MKVVVKISSGSISYKPIYNLLLGFTSYKWHFILKQLLTI